MNIISETLSEDGGQWVAVVEVQGIKYRASFVANKLNCGLVPYKHNPRRPRWHIKAVSDWAEKQVAALAPEWMQLHRELYA